MSALFNALRERTEVNARHAVETFTSEVSEYQAMPTEIGNPLGMYDFAVFIRRRSLDLAAAERPLTERDLAGIAAVESAKNDIIAHTDRIAAADVQACARQHTIEFTDIDSMSRTVLQLWAQSATGCATLATSYANAVQTPQAVDDIGAVLPALFAIVIAARGRAGLVNGINLVVQDQIRAYETVVAKLTPTNCVKKGNKEPGTPREKWWECTAYNGDWGQSTWVYAPAEPVRAQAENAATRNTSRPPLLDGLPRLRALGA
ncbi:hypothetical protein [Actinoplanes regularis]|uniref:Uncharacterized protein n=1 Tax=Actinoplanes regularis TaxID=52697 RepID=A0A238YAG3_9ACTN|nr:hypothetical protein [Actinoplanes regularis]GIE86082.1 hypothetical protein Are01nite_25620 [Actinoplanes regularis]SNR67584.1 hypothetical protein SAMN06264365_104367 [Actinoplanes regularis]